MGEVNKRYVIEVASSKESLKKFKTELQNALQAPFDQAAKEGRIQGLTNQEKNRIQTDLATLFGVADYQADALRKMMQSIVPKDQKEVKAMKNNLRETLEFATSIVQKMQSIDNVTNWSKHGINIADQFESMSKDIGKIAGLEAAIKSLTDRIDSFNQTAVAPYSGQSVMRGLSDEAKELIDQVSVAQQKLDGLKRAKSTTIKDIAGGAYKHDSKKAGWSVEDAAKFSADDVKKKYQEVSDTIKTTLQEIADYENNFAGMKTDMYKKKPYQDMLTSLQQSLATARLLENHSLFGKAFEGLDENLNATLRRVTSEITDSVSNAGKKIQDIVDQITGDGIEIALTIPDAKSAEFTSKISDFVKEATQQFKDNPIEVSVDVVSPFNKEAYDDKGELKALTDHQKKLSDEIVQAFKNNAEAAGVEIGDMDLTGPYHQNVNKTARNVLDAFNKMYGAMTSGQKLLATAARSWRAQMEEEFTVKPKFNTEQTKEDIKAAIGELQDEFDKSDEDSASFWITARPDSRKFIDELQDALKDKSVTVNVKAGEIDASGAPVDLSNVKFTGDVPPAPSGGQPAAGSGTTPVAPPKPSDEIPAQAPVVQENSDAITESTRTQKVLNEAIKQLNSAIQVNSDRIKMIQSMEGRESPDEIIARTTAALDEMTRVRSQQNQRKLEIDEKLKTETDPAKRDELTKERRDIEQILNTQWKHFVDLETKRTVAEIRKKKIEDGQVEEEKKSGAKKYEDENKRLEKYRKALEETRDNGDNPTGLVVKELKNFWNSVIRGKTQAKEEGDVVAENRWALKGSAMAVKGLDLTTVNEKTGKVELVSDEEAFKIVESVLSRNKSLAANLLQDSAIKSSAYVQRMGYYIPQVQKTMGIVPMSSEAADRELNLNENFKSALKLNEYIKRARTLLKMDDKDVDPADIQKFIDYFGHFPEMAESIEYAKQYLTEMQNVAGEPWKNKDQKTYQQQMSDMWDTLDADSKAKFIGALNKSDAANGYTFTDDANIGDKKIYSVIRDAYQEEGSELRQLVTDNPQLNSILAILQRSALLNNTRVASKVFDSERRDGKQVGLLSALHTMQKDSGTVHATVVGRDGQEKVLELNGGKSATDADKRYIYTPKSLERFARNSGKQKEMDELVDAMFDPAILAKDRLEAEISAMERKINSLKLGKPSIDAFDGTDLEKSWRRQKKAESLKISFMDYLEDGSINDILFNSFKELREEAGLRRINKQFEHGEVPRYFEDKIKDLVGQEREDAISAEAARKKAEYESVQNRNRQKAIQTLILNEKNLTKFREENKNAITELIAAETQLLEAKKKELYGAYDDKGVLVTPGLVHAALPAEKLVEEKSKALFDKNFRLSANANAATPLWAQEEQFVNTVLGQYNEKTKQLEKSISSHKNGGVSQMVKNAMKTFGLSEKEARERVLASLEAQLAEHLANPPSKEDIVKGLLVRDEDIKRAKARASKEASQSNKRERVAERVASEDDKGAYERTRKARRDSVENRDYHLEGLLSQIGLAGDNGIMDVGELSQLAADYREKLAAVMKLPMRGEYMSTSEMAANEAERKINEMISAASNSYKAWAGAQKEFGELTAKLQRGEITEQEYKASGVEDRLNAARSRYEADKKILVEGGVAKNANDLTDAAIKSAGDAYNDLDAARKALLDKFFGTKGWNVARALQNELAKYDGQLADKEREIRSEAESRNADIDAEVNKVKAQEAANKAAADRYAESLVDTYIRGPQEQVAKALRDSDAEVAAVKQNTQAQKDALQLRVQDGTYLEGQIANIKTERSKNQTLNEIAKQRKQLTSMVPSFGVFDEISKLADKYYSDPEIVSLLNTRQQMRDNKQTKTPQYSDLLKTISQKSKSYVDEVNLVIGRAIDQAIDKKKLEEAKAKLLKDKKPLNNELRVIEDLLAGKNDKYDNADLNNIQEKYAKYDQKGLLNVKKNLSKKIASQDKELQIIDDISAGNTKNYLDKESQDIQSKLRNLADTIVKSYLDQIKTELGDRAPIKDPFLRNVFERERTELTNYLSQYSTIEADINAGYDARINALRQLAESDKVIHEQASSIRADWIKETDPIEQEMKNLREHGGLSSDRYKELTEQRAQVNIKYSKAIKEAQDKWIAEQSAEIEAAGQEALAALAGKSGVDTSGTITKFNQMASQKLGREVNAKNYTEIQNIIDEMKANAYAEAEAAALQAMENIDRSKGIAPEDVEKRVAAARAETEANKMAVTALMRSKTDAEVMATYHEEAAENLDKAAAESRDHAAALKKEQDADMARYGITDEMLQTARENAVLSGEMAEAREKEKKAVEQQAATSAPTPQQTPGGGRPASGGYFGAIDASNLAKESTLRGIYELLNGAPPEGGWGDNKLTSGIQTDLDVSVKSFSGVLSNLASGVAQVVRDISTLPYENMAFLNDERRVGEYIQGNQNVIDASRIKGFLGKHAGTNLKLALHNHPDGISALSPADIESAIVLAKKYGVGATGSITPDKITGVDFSDVSAELAIGILNAYKKNIRESGFANIFDEGFEVKPEYASSLLDDQKRQLSDELNNLLKKAISDVDLNVSDIFGQVDVSGLDDATAQVANEIVEAGAQAAVETAKSASFTKADIDAKQSEFQKQFKTAKLKNGKTGFDIAGASKLDQAMYNVGDLLNKDITALSKSEFKNLTTAYDQIEKGLQQDIKDKLEPSMVEFLNALKAQLSEKIAAKEQKNQSIKAAKESLSKLKADDVSGAGMAKTGVSWIYEALDNNQDKLVNTHLTQLAKGYQRLQDVVNHAIFDTLDENTKQVIQTAIKDAEDVLKKYNVTIQTKELVGTVLDASNKDSFTNANSKDRKAKTGRTIKSVAEPQVMRDGKIISNATVYLSEAAKKNEQERAAAAKKTTSEMQKQNQLAAEGAQKAEQTADATKKQADAAAQVTEEKKEAKAADSGKKSGGKKSGSSGVTPPGGGDTGGSGGKQQGGFLGVLNALAKEATLQSIAAILSNGIKVSSDGKQGDASDKKKKDVNISADDAWTTAQEHIRKNYPDFTSIGSLKPVSGGYSIDVFQPKNLEEIAKLQEKINNLRDAGQADTPEFIAAQETLNGLLLEQEKITLRIGMLNNELQVTQEKTSFQNLAVGSKAAAKELQTVDAIMSRLHESGAISIGEDGKTTSNIDSVKNYLNALDELRDYQARLKPADLLQPGTEQKLSELTTKTQQFKKEMLLLLDAVSRTNLGKHEGFLNIDLNNTSQVKQSMQDMLSQNGKAIASFGDLEKVTNKYGVVSYELAYTIRTGKREVQEMTAYLNPLTKEITVQEGALKRTQTGWEKFWSGLKGKFASITQYIVSITSIQDIFRYLREGIQHVRDIDSALTELKKVTDETDVSYRNFLQDMAKTGSVIGSTVKDLTTMASEWARLGYSMEEAGRLAESTAILLNVSEFKDATEASEALISTMQAFQYTADESQHVVDILNEVGNNYAVSSDGIATALQDSASALMEAGNNLEQSVALVAAANKVVQDPNSVGKQHCRR